MGGNRAGGIAARDTNLANDPDFYKKIGTIGGSRSRTGGWYANRDLASAAGRIGGMVSRRGRQMTHKERQQYKSKIDRAYKHVLSVQRKAQMERRG